MTTEPTPPLTPARALPAPPRYFCGACGRKVLPVGRRLQRVDGARTWIGPCCYRPRNPEAIECRA